MARVKRGVTTHARHKKVLKQSKGFFGRSSTNYRIALERLEKSLQYAYRDRRVKKREFRGLWIQRINAAVREHGLTYSRFIFGLKTAGIEMDRKVLAAIAFDDAATFAEIVRNVQAVLEQAPSEAAATEHPEAEPVQHPEAEPVQHPEAEPVQHPEAEPAYHHEAEPPNHDDAEPAQA